MAKIERFEEIRAWQMAKDLVAEIYPQAEKATLQEILLFNIT